jgi:hypothetical protein
MDRYIGNGLVFPISGREEVGVVVEVNLDQLKTALEAYEKSTPYEHLALVFTVLPLKPINVTTKKTHSVKLTNIIEA